MFGVRGPLLQEAGEGDGGGGYVPPLQRIIPNAYKSTVGAFNPVTLPGVPGTQPEAGPPKSETPEPEQGASTQAAGGSRKGLQTGPKIPGAPKGTRDGWRGNIQLQSGVAPDVQLGMQFAKDRIQQAETLQHFVNMRASNMTEEQQLRWAALNDQDAGTAQALAREQFPRIRQKIEQIQREVDEAKALKTDPYHWHESIGRGGRVAAAFAALTGGFAAGRANPNSALNMLDAAIERDIAAQEANRTATIQLLQTQRGLLQDERQVLEEEFQSMDRVRALKYAGIVGRIEAAQQHAVTEAHHLALQTAKDHYNLKMLEAIAAAQQEVFTLEFEGPIRNAEKIASLKSQIAQFQQQLQTAPSGGVMVPTEQVATLEGEVAGARPEAEIRLAPAPGRGGAVAARGRRPGRGLAAGGQGRRVSGQQAVPEGSTPAIPEGAVAQDEQGRYLDAEGNVVDVGVPEAAAPPEQQPGGQPEARQIANQVAQSIEVPAHIRQKGSFARAIAAEENRSVSRIPTWGEAISDLQAGREIRDGGMVGIDDAEVIREYLKDKEPIPANYAGGEASAAYKLARQQWQHTQNFPETLERDSYLAGEYAKVRTGSGRSYSILVGSRDPKNFARIREEVVKADQSITALEDMASTIRQVGLTGLITEDGKWQIPGITSTDERSMELMNNAITQAMNYIKTHDPTARISDKDLEVGFEAAVPYLGRGTKFIDFLQSIMGNDNKRRQVERFLAKLAAEAQRIFWNNMANDLVPDYNTLHRAAKNAEKVDAFIYNKRGNPAE